MTNVTRLSNDELVAKLKTLVVEEKKNVAAQIVMLKAVKQRGLAVALGYPSLIEFCEKELGLSRDQAWKRSQAAGVVAKEPLFLNMLKNGETSVSTLAVIAPKLSENTAEQFKAFIPHRSRREAEAFASTMKRDGTREAGPATIKVPLQLRPATLGKLNRVRKLLRQSKAELSDDQLVDELLEHILERRDPARKAARAQKRQAEKGEKTTAPGQAQVQEAKQTKQGAHRSKRYIPAVSRHAVHSSEDYRCAYRAPDGRRCTETAALQIDHIAMWSRGGGHEVKNLRLMCGAHNRYLAEQAMEEKSGLMDAG